MDIDMDRIHELAVAVSAAACEGSRNVVEGYAYDDNIRPEEMVLALIYSGCQAVGSAIDSAVKAGADRDGLTEIAVSWILAGFEQESVQ